jgi:hypothetical protein
MEASCDGYKSEDGEVSIEYVKLREFFELGTSHFLSWGFCQLVSVLTSVLVEKIESHLDNNHNEFSKGGFILYLLKLDHGNMMFWD